MTEIFRTIEGFEDYKISNFGVVKSIRTKKEKILKQTLARNGYYYVSLFGEEREQKSIHSLVVSNFLRQEPAKGEVIMHKDFNKLNNKSDNLEVVTNSEFYKKKKECASKKYLNVYYIEYLNKWVSIVDSYHTGYFDTELEAFYAL